MIQIVTFVQEHLLSLETKLHGKLRVPAGLAGVDSEQQNGWM